MSSPILPRAEQLRQLRAGLATLYPNVADAQRLAADAGLATNALDLQGTPLNIWHKVLAEAEKQQKTARLFELAQFEYPDNPTLQAVERIFFSHRSQEDLISAQLVMAETTLPDVPCPYRGLEPFEAIHAANYFGRTAMVEKLLAKVATTNFVAVVGPSGSGKSSLVRAGLLTSLRTNQLPGSHDWAIELVRPGEEPLRTLATPLINRLSPALSPVDRLKEVRKLAAAWQEGSLPIGDVLAQVRGQLSGAPRLFLIIDQFEEAFTLCNDETIQRTFLNTLLAAAHAPWVTILLTLRADFFGRLLSEARLGERVDSGLVNILPMTPAERRAAIEAPAHNAGRRFADGLVQRIVDAVATEPGQLPLLEFALTELWARQTPDGLLTHAAYAEIGEVSGAIARCAEQTLQGLPSAEQAAVRKIFTRLVRVAPPEEGTEDTKRRIALHELDALAQSLVRRLTDARLLVSDRDAQSGLETIEVAHEALIRNWRELQSWLNSDREFLLWRQRLGTLVANWLASKRDAGALLRGALLTEANAWLQTRPGDLSEQERGFVTASQQLAQREAAEKEAARQRELEQQRQLAAAEQRRTQTVRRWLLVAMLLFPAAVVAAFYAISNARSAQRNADLAQKQVARLTGEQWLKEARIRKVRINNAVLNSAPATAPFVSPLPVTIGSGTPITASEPFTSPDAIVNEVAIIRRLLAQASAADPTMEVDRAAEEADVLRQAATRLVHEGERLAAQGKSKEAGVLFQRAFDLQPPPDTLLYVWIAPGEFRMGSSDADSLAQDNEKPQHTVTLDGYWIMRTEVTNAQYARCVAAKACDAPNNQRWNKSQFADQPVTDVGWQQASVYAQWVGGRLPSEAQWENACRGSDARLYPWGDEAPSAERLNYFDSGLTTWTNVGTYPAGANGLYDMAGNVYEWTADWLDVGYYANSPTSNPQGPESGIERTLRGGSFAFDTPSASHDQAVRCADRTGNTINLRVKDVGFRVVASGN